MSKVKLKKHFITGVLATLPLFVTIYILYFIYKIIAGIVMMILPIEFITKLLIFNNEELQSKEKLVAFTVFLVSFAIFSGVVYLAGLYINKVINKGTSKYVENILNRIPVAKSIYSMVKQISDIVFSKEAATYKKVVLVEYPRDGLFALGLVSNEENKTVSDVINGVEVYNVFIPTTPNPTTGFYIVVPQSKAIDTDYTVEEAFKLVVSAGALEPERNDGVKSND
ncbi:MAG: DUF502 domain-containing protein [Fusobacteriaceae bacterium]|nr:DUF502 domain-containing protein [Fusobacteriaceae bacterium]